MPPAFAVSAFTPSLRCVGTTCPAHRHLRVRMTTGAAAADGRVLVCDVLDTLVADPFSRGMHSHFGFADMPSFIAAKRPGTWEAFELGTLSEADLGLTFFRDANRTIDVAGLKQFLRSSYVLFPGIADLLADFRDAGVPVHLCSNYGPWDSLIEAAVGLAEKHGARWTFVSAEHGARKPDREAYEMTAKVAGVRMEQCVLLDDRERNCTGAINAGYRGAVKFSDAARARTELAEFFGDWLLRPAESG